jgi:serine/threonine protein kinase
MPMYPSTLAHVEPPMLAVSAMRVGKQILETLEGAHARGICHNDIKSPNIFIDQGGEQPLDRQRMTFAEVHLCLIE